MTPDQELDLFQSLGRIEAKMENFNNALLDHTAQDAVNFQKIENDLEALKLSKAKAEGIAEEAAKHASSAGGKMGGFVATVISVVVAGVSAYFGKAG